MSNPVVVDIGDHTSFSCGRDREIHDFYDTTVKTTTGKDVVLGGS
jgi:hypothetical protein